MALDLTLREFTNGVMPGRVDGYAALEAAVAATTAIPFFSSLVADAGNPVMNYPGVIVGMWGASEVGSNFTVQCTVDGTADTGNTMTMDSAAEYVNFVPADYVAFTVGQTVGMKCIADTTSKDFVGGLLVLFDVSDD